MVAGGAYNMVTAIASAPVRLLRKASIVVTSSSKSKKIAPSAPARFVEGKRLADRMWIQGIVSADVNAASERLLEGWRKTSSALQADCQLIVAHIDLYSGSTSHLVGIAKGSDANTLVGCCNHNRSSG